MTARQSPGTVVGRPLPKVDAWAKVTGAAVYTDDLSFSGMLFGRLVRCGHPHARILGIEAEAALSIPGVKAVITGADIENAYGVLPVSQDEYGLSPDKGRYVGEAVAAVAAVDEETARQGVEAVVVRYEALGACTTVDEALADGAPAIHGAPRQGAPHRPGRPPNLHKAVALAFGDVSGGFAAADRVQEDLFHYAGSNHIALEEHAVVAVPAAGGGVTLWSATQTPHYVQRSVARALGLAEHKVRVAVVALGGGFGGKAEALPHEVAAAKLALVTGRPVKIRLSREEVFYSHRGRHPVTMRLRTGVAADGTLTAMHVQTVLDGGAYGSYGVATTYYTGALQTVTYRLGAYRFEAARVYTNKPPCGPKRGHGTPQGRFALEVQLDKIAHAMGLGPAEVRLRNLVAANTPTVNHMRVTSCGLRECIEAVVAASEFRQRHGRLPRGRGLGLACGAYLSGAGLPVYWNDLPHSTVVVQVDRSGRVTAQSGATDIGQGSDTILATIVADVLGLAPADIRLVTADTGVTPVDLGSYSSRVTFMMGNAALDASRSLRGRILAAVARDRGTDEAALTMAGGKVCLPEGAGEDLTLAEAVRIAEAAGAALSAEGSYRPPDLAGPYRGSGVGPSPAYSYSACVVEAKVDEGTGAVEPAEVWLAHDVGRALNPQLVEGQIEGGVYMGLSEALLEEQAFRGPLHAGPSLLEVKTPTALDVPPIHAIIVETVDAEGPYGAKEVGQGPLLPVPPAVANAVFDAVGVRVDEVPITPDKVHRAMELARRGKGNRVGPKRFPAVTFPDVTVVPPPAGAPVPVTAGHGDAA